MSNTSQTLHGHVQPHDDDDELDNLLEEELAASLHRHGHANLEVASTSQPFVSSGSSSHLTFAFPGWGVDIFRDPKRRKPSVVRHEAEESSEKGEEPDADKGQEVKGGAWGVAAQPGNGSDIYKMPNEIMLNVMKRLSVRDLCAAIQTCQWLQQLGSQDEIWDRFGNDLEDTGCRKALNRLPRWATVKNDVLSAQVKGRVAFQFCYYLKGFEHLRSALHSWWDTSMPNDKFNSKAVQSLIRKMTAHDWTLVYEFFGVIFAERADWLATILMEELQKTFKKNGEVIQHLSCSQDFGMKESDAIKSNREHINIINNATPAFDVSLKEERRCEFKEGLIGKEVWDHVHALWKQYKQWTTLVFRHCPELNYAVMLERARSTRLSSTPTVYDKGAICFRSQVLLKFGVRKVLQSGFSWLTAQDSSGTASELEVELLRSIYHLLQEVDVLDDSTLSPKSFTQAKLRRCFPIRRSHAKVICC